jgi:predicted phage tail protein
MSEYMNNETNISGSRGSRGGNSNSGGHTPVEAPNTLRTKTTARVQFLLSQGEIGGLYDQTNRLKSVYFNNTPVQNSDGTFNFEKVLIEERYGLPSQSVMSGFPQAINTFNIAQKVTVASPVTHTTTTSSVDAVRVTIRFPALIEQATNGDTNGTTVQFGIYTRLGLGSWNLIQTVTKTDKTITAADADYFVNRPSGGTTWSVQVRRVTADNTASNKQNDIYFQRAAEIQNVQKSYDNRAYIGLTVSAETTGQNFPNISFDVNGIKVKVPSNYNVGTRAYTGVWDGTFAASKQVCDNPAWVLYDILTNAEYGLGSIISESDIDKYSFYDAAVYNDGLVPNATATGSEPRYTFNYQFMQQMDAWSMIQNIAAAFNAAVYTSGNLVKLVQDRPTSWSRVLSNSNVVDGVFEYSSSQKSTRHTAVVVYWNDPSQNLLSVPCYYQDDTAIARYGLNSKEMTVLGITSEGQALRMAKWVVDTSINNTDTIIFRVGHSNIDIEPGDVVKIADSDYAMIGNEAKVVSATTNALVLDRPITVASGDTFDVVSSDGETVFTRTITNTGTTSSITYSGADITSSVIAGCDIIFTGVLSPRYFKITNVTEEAPGVLLVSGLQYDENKFGRVDNTPTGLIPLYQATPAMTVISPVTGITFSEESLKDADGKSHRYLVTKWTPPVGQFVNSYVVFWSKNNGIITQMPDVYQPFTRFEIEGDGTYQVTVYAFNSNGVKSAPATGSTTILLAAPVAASPLSAATTLQCQSGKGIGTSFYGTDCAVQWTNPNTISGGSVSQDYEVAVLNSAGTVTYRTEYVTTNSYVYTLDKQNIDNPGSPQSSFIIRVRVRDTWGRVSLPLQATFTALVLSAPSSLVKLDGTANTTFISEALAVTWSDASTNSEILSYYEVTVKSTTGTTYRTDNIGTIREFTYDMVKQEIDNPGTPQRSFQIYVRSCDIFGRFTSSISNTYLNPAPNVPANISSTGVFKGATIKWDAIADSDIKGYIIWRGTTAGFTISSSNMVFDGTATSFNDIGLADNATYYYRLAAYDVFGKSYSGTGLNVSSALTVVTSNPDNTNEYILTGVTWTPNSPSANSVAWTACTAAKTQGTSAGTTWSITAGSAPWTSGIVYIYYTEGETLLRYTTSITTAIANNKIIVATYRGGTNLEYGDGRAYMDGGFIIAGTVGAGQLVTGTAVITQSAQIAASTITNALIGDAAITNAKISDLTVETLKLKNGSITQTQGVTSNTIVYGYAQAVPSQTSINYWDSGWQTITTQAFQNPASATGGSTLTGEVNLFFGANLSTGMSNNAGGGRYYYYSGLANNAGTHAYRLVYEAQDVNDGLWYEQFASSYWKWEQARGQDVDVFTSSRPARFSGALNFKAVQNAVAGQASATTITQGNYYRPAQWFRIKLQVRTSAYVEQGGTTIARSENFSSMPPSSGTNLLYRYNMKYTGSFTDTTTLCDYLGYDTTVTGGYLIVQQVFK